MDEPTQVVLGASGPWQGMQERESYQTPSHCRLAFNVDFSRGYIESRDSFRWNEKQAFPMLINAPIIHLGKRPDAEPYVLIAGVSVNIRSAVSGAVLIVAIVAAAWPYRSRLRIVK